MAESREQLKQITQRRVVDTAGQLFQELGFTSTTIRAIAETSGVSVGTVMAVGDKNALLVRVFDTLLAAEHAARTSSDIARHHRRADNCVDRLMGLVDPFITIFTDRTDLARIYAAILVSGSQTSAVFTDLADQLTQELRTAITQNGCTPPADASATADALYLAYIGTLFSWSAQKPPDADELAAGLRPVFAAICTCTEE